jgi:AraC family transcriptional regulator of adaptative response / DNA-3-methyladenine glycosylase II
MAVRAVTTTGIYCRASCSARPHPRNVTTYETVVAAEAAGFHPCLRCRPDRGPGSIRTLAVPEPLGHALMLITDGFLDSQREEALAERVGYSVRQLRRLFVTHIGATPSAIARSRRTHFARRLIDDTDLDFGTIARAAGFGGVRQLHRATTTTFRRSPSELRARRRTGARHDLDGGLALELPYTPPYDFGQMLTHLRARCIPGVETVDGGTYRRSIDSCGHPGVAEVRDGGDGRHLLLTLHLPTFDSIIDEVERCRTLFALDEAPLGDRDELVGDPVLGPLASSHPTMRVPRAWDRFETAVRIVIGQQISVAGASTMIGRVVERHGTPFGSGVAGVDRRFPAPLVLADAKLDGLGFTARRCDTIRGLAAGVANGDIDLYCTGDIDSVTRALCEVPGIGPWTAHMIAMRVLGHDDAMPASDLGLRRGLARLTGGEVSAAELAHAAEAWRPARSWAAQLLWSAADPAAPARHEEQPDG